MAESVLQPDVKAIFSGLENKQFYGELLLLALQCPETLRPFDGSQMSNVMIIKTTKGNGFSQA